MNTPPALATGWRAAFPPAQWLPSYQGAWLGRDAVAGVTLAAYAIPVALAYATLAGLPPQYGIYCYLVRRMIEELKPESVPSLAALKAAVKRQAFVLALDEERAIEALPKLAPEMHHRRKGHRSGAARHEHARRADAVPGRALPAGRGHPRARRPGPGAEVGMSANRHEKYQRLIEAAKALEPVTTAVAHPCDESSLSGAVDAAKLGLIKPILVGPKAKIEAVAKQFNLDISRYELVDAPHSHAAAAKAVELVNAGKAEALMKGSLHTDELMAEVVKKDTGLRTARRISHCFVMDVPTHPDALIISDAAVNIAPTLEDKVDIVQNAIDLARALGRKEVRVAILSAMETVNPKVPSTIEAAALCKMADRGQITGGILDGPLALDNAISPEAAEIKKIASPVAGRANVLIVPDLEAGNMLAKSLSFLAGADSAGIVLGAKVPIILTSRADSVEARLASCAVAVFVAQARRESAAKAIA